MLARDCCILCRRSPSRSLKSPLVGRLKREWRVWPWMLNAATPPAAPHQPLSTRLRRIHRIRAHARPHNAVHSPSYYWGERERAPHLWIKRKFVYIFIYLYIYIYIRYVRIPYIHILPHLCAMQYFHMHIDAC